MHSATAKRSFTILVSVMAALLMLTGCSKIGEKNTSLSFIYGATSILSALLLWGYCALLKEKDKWFVFLFSSVCVVNIGYLLISISRNLEEALFANCVSYLGSVFLPLTMLMIILNLVRFKYSKHILWGLVPVTAAVFFITASPGYLDIYYKTVTFSKESGTLCKEYGPWHKIYLFYLLAYFIAMIAIIVYSKLKNKIESPTHAVILLSAVFVNIGVWLLEQLVEIGFEFLSVSYIISELFLLGLYLILQDKENMGRPSEQSCSDTLETEHAITTKPVSAPATDDRSEEFGAHCRYIKENLYRLTPTERAIYDMYLEGKGTKDIMKTQDITENTLKYHNKNIYSKLWVSSRKQLIEYSMALKDSENNSASSDKTE